VETLLQALVMGVVQGLTEFLPVSSSGHLVLVPALLGWDDPLITSLEFSVVIHIGTLIALLAYFRHDWLRLVPAGFAAIRDRSLADDPDRRLAWLLAAATIPAGVAGFLLQDLAETTFRTVELVVAMVVVGGLILFTAERLGRRNREIGGVTFPIAVGIGCAQALALVPGISRSGISISAGLLAGLERETAARFSFLLATPITAAAAAWEARALLTGEATVTLQAGPLLVGIAAAMVSGFVAIAVLLRFLRTRSTDVFVAYRLVLAAVVVAWLVLGGGGAG
jgi:undecaprenyl-diphosphatase